MNHSITKQYFSKLPKHIRTRIGKQLGSGLEGVVYSYGKNKVIKIATAKDEVKGEDWNLKQMLTTIKALKRSKIKTIIRIDTYGILSDKDEIYFYTAPKLEPLSTSEKRFVENVLVSDYDLKYGFISEQRLEMHSKLLKFLKSLVRYNDCDYKFELCDIHSGNIMKTKGGEYKLVDFGYVEMRKR